MFRAPMPLRWASRLHARSTKPDSTVQEAARVSYLLQSMAFADSHHHPAPTDTARALCAQRTQQQLHLRALALAPEAAPRSSEQNAEMAAWPPGEHLDWVIDMAIAHIHSRTVPAG